MKSKATAIILTTMAMALALSCGPGNGTAPYKGTPSMEIGAMSNFTVTTSGGMVLYDLDLPVYDGDTLDPLPNIEVEIFYTIIKQTLQDYSTDMIIMYGDDSTAIGPSGTVKSHSDFQGRVTASILTPLYFDGVIQIIFSLSSNFSSFTETVIFDSGTTCTDGTDNNDDGKIDIMDPICIALGPYGSEPTGGVIALSAAQVPPGRVATGGTVTITPTGGTGPYTYLSGTPGVATVNPTTGVVAAVAVGSTTITVTDSAAASVNVTVTVADLATITITPATANVAVGATTTLTATFFDGTATALVGLTLVIGDWTSDATGVADITAVTATTATVTGGSSGTANIDATVGVITSNISVITVP